MTEKKTPYIIVAGRILYYAFKAAPFYLMADCLGMLISSSSFVLGTLATQNMFETVTYAVQQGIAGDVIMSVMLMTAVLIFNELMNGICNFLAWPANLRIRGAFMERIHQKISALPAIHFENEKTLNLIQKASQGAENGIDLYHSVSTLIFFYGPYFVIMGIYLYYLRPILAFCVFFLFIPMLVSQILRERIFSELIDESVSLERKLKYYEKEIYHREYFKETRILGIYSFIKHKYNKTMELFCDKRWKATRKIQIIEIGLRSLTFFGYSGVLYLLISSLLQDYITVGAFAAIFSSTNILIAFMTDAVSNYWGKMLESYGSLRNFIYFLDIPEDTGRTDDISFKNGIEISGLSFRYPNALQNSLESISLKINSGETIAFVGQNGAGKTTLVRIITGILSPSEGKVLADGIPITDYCKKSRFKFISGVIQRFGKYKMTLKQNVLLSDWERTFDEEKMYKSLEQSDFELKQKSLKLKDGVETILSREFGGIDLSGGEWQRVALARGLYKDSKLIVLDEPTSAIDPIEESLLYEKFRELSRNKIAVLVTHRLGSAKIADRIVVLDKGRIIEIGTHKELMDAKGMYFEMFSSQAKWYVSS